MLSCCGCQKSRSSPKAINGKNKNPVDLDLSSKIEAAVQEYPGSGVSGRCRSASDVLLFVLPALLLFPSCPPLTSMMWCFAFSFLFLAKAKTKQEEEEVM